MKAIDVQGLHYAYQSGIQPILNKLDFSVAAGTMVGLIGLSGCGKTTLCLCLAGIIPHCQGGIMQGNIYINGRNTRELPLAQLALEVGMVFQDPDNQLFLPTVEEEIAFAPENLCLPPQAIRERVEAVLELLGLTQLRNANPQQLSGGQKHLVALGGVLALDPGVLILDEVMAGLDDDARAQVHAAIMRVHDQGKTLIMIEHDLNNIKFVDRMLLIEAGSIIRDAPPEELLADRTFLAKRKLYFDTAIG